MGGGLAAFGESDQFSLNDTYLAYDLRESYLQRQSNPFGNQADSTILATDDFETKTCNLWRASDQKDGQDSYDAKDDTRIMTHKERVSNNQFLFFELLKPVLMDIGEIRNIHWD